MLPRRQIQLRQVSAPLGSALTRLSGIEGFARALVSGVIPVLAFTALGNKQAVSMSFAVGGVFALAVTLSFSRLERIVRRRRAMALGFILSMASAALNLVDGVLFALGIGFRAAAASLVSVGLSLLIMDIVERQHLTLVESNRMIYVGAAWLIGPSLGLWLAVRFGRGSALGLSALAALVALALFWRMGIGDDEDPDRHPPLNPIRSIRRYFDQPYLRIAYSVTLCRSMYWVALFVYGPIYVSEAGLPTWVAGVMLSSVSAFLFLSPLVRVAADRFGTRSVIVAGFTALATGMLGLGLIRTPSIFGVVIWVVSALAASALDVLGNIPFMRTVKKHERLPMTAVFSTWREVSTLTTPLLASIVLLVGPFWVFYLLLGALAAATAVAASYLPRRI